MPSFAYYKKQIIPLEQAQMGIMTHALHYGTALFEGIRGNWNAKENQLYLFRLKEHYERMLRGCRMLNMNLPYSVEDLCRITVEVAQKCGFKEDVYVRPVSYKSTEQLGVRLHNLEEDFFVFAFPWGKYLDVEYAKCGVSSWRASRETPRAKINGLYVTNAMAKTEAISNGFDEGIMLNADGYVAEGTGENLFMVVNGKLITPAPYDDILMCITRDTVITIAKNELGLETEERHILRSELYGADEVFLTGTAAHLTPVGEIDRRPIGAGGVGPLTKKLQALYFSVITGENKKYINWCAPVYK